MPFKSATMDIYPVRVLDARWVTHNVRQFTLDKPKGYTFVPGQATEITLPEDKWKDARRPFTFTGLNDWDHLEFTIKIYPERHGVTEQLGLLKKGDEIVLHDVWGAIQYKGEGTFIAGGAGVTPFIAIFRQLQKDGLLGNNQLFFSNKTERDIILREQWDEWLGPRAHYVLSQEKVAGLEFGKIDEAWLKGHIHDFKQQFYVCGPDKMVEDVKKTLERLGGANAVVTVEL
jgi:ferredoxin-NADP reductase